MKCRELLAIEHPDKVDDELYTGGCDGCPSDYGYLSRMVRYECPCFDRDKYGMFRLSIESINKRCRECWDREVSKKIDDCIPEPETIDITTSEDQQNGVETYIETATGKIRTKNMCTGAIKDSGNRREFETGAVRDIQEGKGRCDLMPLDVVAAYYAGSQFIRDDACTPAWVFHHICLFQKTGNIDELIAAVKSADIFAVDSTMFLEVAKHFEDGAKKYGEYNWQKGIPTRCYIDSAIRHYLKFLRGDTDEPHDRAFVWNILCCIWTCKNKPELNDYAKKEEEET